MQRVTQVGLGTFGDKESWFWGLVSCCCSAECISCVIYFRVFWSGYKTAHWAVCFVKLFQQQEESQESLIQLEEGAERLRFNYSLRDKLWIQDDWSRGLFPRREQPFMSGGFAQRLTVIICHSNYLLHDLFFVCYISHLLRALLLTPPSARSNNQLIITRHQNTDWIWGLACTRDIQDGKVDLRVASGFWIDWSRHELFTLYSCVEGYFCS